MSVNYLTWSFPGGSLKWQLKVECRNSLRTQGLYYQLIITEERYQIYSEWRFSRNAIRHKFWATKSDAENQISDFLNACHHSTFQKISESCHSFFGKSIIHFVSPNLKLHNRYYNNHQPILQLQNRVSRARFWYINLLKMYGLYPF